MPLKEIAHEIFQILPKEKKTFGYKWILNVKYKADKSVNQYKTELVAKRCIHYRIGYQEIFAPIT